MAVDYNSLSNVYASSRSASRLVVEELVTQGRINQQSQVLEVGCGTADHIAAIIKSTGCRGWGVEPSSGMRSHAPNLDRLQVIGGRAESLPLQDDQLDFVFTVNVVHHMTDTAAFLHEAGRILKPGGRVCTVTESTAMIRQRIPLACYWPATVEPEIERYPALDDLLHQMRDVGFTDCTIREIGETVSITDAAAYRQQAFSSLLLITESEFSIGLQKLEADLHSGPVEGLAEYACLWGALSEISG